MVPQFAFAAMHNAGPFDEPVEQAGGFVGGVGILQTECQCSSATQLASQVAVCPAGTVSVQQCLVPEYAQIAATQPEMLEPLSHDERSAASVQVRSCEQVPGPPVVPAPHLLWVHVWPLPHVPQLNVPPHPSETVPHVAPSAEQVVGVQPPEHDETGLVVGVGQSSYAKPAALVNFAANCAQPLSHVLVQQYAWAESAHTSWTQ
jgi:hypothetical protein